MCQNCSLQFCSYSCPHYKGYLPSRGLPHRICSSCGNGIYNGELYYVISERVYCKDCVGLMYPDDLADAFGFPNVTYLIEALGGKFCQDNF